MTTDPADEGSDRSSGSIVRHANLRVKELVMPQYPRREAPSGDAPPSGREGRSGFLSSLETSSSISPRPGSCDPPLRQHRRAHRSTSPSWSKRPQG